MSELGQCQDGSCSNEEENNLTVRVFPCLYHCKKMLCLKHLLEHDRNLDQHSEIQHQLKQTWKIYLSMIDENKIEKQIEQLRTKLDDYRQLTRQIADLLINDPLRRAKPTVEQLRIGIEALRRAIVRENGSMPMITNIAVKDEFVMNNVQETMKNSSHSSSITTQDEQFESQFAVESQASFSHNTEDSLNQIEEQQQSTSNGKILSIVDVSDDDGDPMDFQSDDYGDDGISFRIGNLDDDKLLLSQSSLQFGKRPCPSHHRDYCPLTQGKDGAFGVNSQVHGIRLCTLKPPHEQQTLLLNMHFQKTHNLTPKASLILARAVYNGEDPLMTRLFTNEDIILDVDKLRQVMCPLEKPLFHYPGLSIIRTPCLATRQVRYLQDHLKNAHKLSTTAAKILVKAVKAHEPAHMIEFPPWISIIEEDRYSF